MKLIDLSQYIEAGMPVYPGDSAVELVQVKKYNEDHYNNNYLGTGMHIGTHIDGPMHMLDICKYISDMPLESFCGEGCIIDARGEQIIKPKEKYKVLFRQKDIVLVHTAADEYYGQEKYYSSHPVLDLSFCKMLAESNVKVLGIDAPSPDREPWETHKFLLGNNILIIENLTGLGQINEKDEFEVFAFPLKIKADSCMIRAVARIK